MATASPNRALPLHRDLLGEQADWASLIPQILHPTKVIILEAMHWIGRPLSASELEKIARGQPILSLFSYHLAHLVRLEILEVVGKFKVRPSQGAKKETFFFFAQSNLREVIEFEIRQLR